ncbi:MAG: hypothetical protein HZB30_11920 [Nitrospirae bacterium]|nr:hypothetical protein [Nitrospirota bacterium]
MVKEQIQEKSLLKSKPDIANLRNCVEDVKKAALDSDTGPSDPTEYSQLLGRLEASREKLPPLYRETVFKPFSGKLERLGPSGFNKILLNDPDRAGLGGLMLDIAHAILQNGEGYNVKATDSFQEVVSDLYDGFLSAEDRRGVKPPDKGVIPPLVKWGHPDFGPYTWPVDATVSFGVSAGIVNLPPANAKSGLLAWAALGHETAGHDILQADTGLRQELAMIIRNTLRAQKIGSGLPEYWSSRIDETASDVLGILNMGPAAAIGIIGYFRGLNAAYTGKPKLRNDGPENDPHPADILRGYLAGYTVSLLSFSGADNWSKVIESETDEDLSKIRLEGTVVSAEMARRSAKIVASTLVRTKMESLENHALGEIQDWRNRDEMVVNKLLSLLTAASRLPSRYASGIYAAHVVAAAVTAGLSKDADIPVIFKRMLGILKTMHDANPSWGPLYVAHPGDITTRMVYFHF